MGKNIVLRLLHIGTLYYETEATCHLLCDFVRAVGGIAWAAWEANEIRIHLSRVSHKDLRIGLDAFCEGTVTAKGSLFLIEMEDHARPGPSDTRIPWGMVLREPRLTRQFLFALPSGCYILSRSGFARKVTKDRELAWRRAVAEGAANRTCYIGWSVPEFEEQKRGWLKTLNDPDPDWYLPVF